MTKSKEHLIDHPSCIIVSDFDIQDNSFMQVAESNEWEVESLTEKAALLFVDGKTIWIPLSVIGFSPSGDLYLKPWFYNKNF